MEFLSTESKYAVADIELNTAISCPLEFDKLQGRSQGHINYHKVWSMQAPQKP